VKTLSLGLLLLIVVGCPPVVRADPGFSPRLFASDELPCNYRRYPGGAALTRAIPDFQRRCYGQAVRRMQRAVGEDADLSEAEATVSALLELDPTSAYGWTGLARLYLRQEALDVAEVPLSKTVEVAERAAHAKPDLADAFVALADAQLQLWCLRCAEEALKRAEALAPSDPDVMLTRATLLSAQGEKAAAEAQFLHALEGMTDAQERALARLALGEHLTRNGDLEGAQHAFEAAAKEDQALLVAQLRLASFLLFERGNSDAAIEAVERSRRARATFEASRLRSLATYLTWAVQCETAGRCEGIAQIAQRSTLTAEEAFITAAGHTPLAPLVHALSKTGTVHDVNARDGEGNTALMAAARVGNVELLTVLLRRGANVNAQNRHGVRALTFAVLKSDLAAVALLLAHEAEPNYADQHGASPLALAILRRQAKIASLLSQRKADPHLEGRWTAADLLNIACANGDVDSVKLLVEAGVDPNAVGQDQAIPLISAVLSGSQPTAAYLLERGADPERRLDGRTALDYARDAGDWALIRMLQARTKRSI